MQQSIKTTTNLLINQNWKYKINVIFVEILEEQRTSNDDREGRCIEAKDVDSMTLLYKLACRSVHERWRQNRILSEITTRRSCCVHLLLMVLCVNLQCSCNCVCVCVRLKERVILYITI